MACETSVHQRTDLTAARYHVTSSKMLPQEGSEDLIEPVPGSAFTSPGTQSASEYTPSVSSSDRTRASGGKTSKGKDGKPRWLSQVKEWFGTGEPSAQDFQQLKRQEFRKRGIALDDPRAHAKMHAPIGQVPKHAIRTAGGPDPDKMAVKRAEERKRQSLNTPPGTAGSLSSRSSTSARPKNAATPWEV